MRARPVSVARPTTLDAARRAVREAAQVRFVAGGCTGSRLVPTDGVLIDTRGLPRSIRPIPGRLAADVTAGVTTGELGHALRGTGLRADRLGTSRYPTLGGALATGVHGTGDALGTLCDARSIEAITVLTVDGDLTTFDQDRPADRDTLAALRVNLGALGLVVEARVALRPGRSLERTTSPVASRDLLDAGLRDGWEQVEAWWVPGTGRALVVRRRPTDEPPRRFDHPARVVLERGLGEDVPLRALIAAVAARPALAPTMRRALARFGMSPGRSVRRWDLATIGPRHLRAVDLEVALPRERLADAMEAVRAAMATPGGSALHIPVNIRWNAADDGAWLSPAFERDTVWVDVGWHPAVPGGGAFLADVEARLLALGGRPHWGKLGFQNPASAFPRFADWARVRDRMDPRRKLVNDHVARLLDGRPLLDPAFLP